jgi:ABC-2 type transport system permease protein
VVEPLRAYVLLAGTWVRAAAQYPVSLAMLIVAQILTTSLDLVAILLIFARTPRLGGFALPEVLFLYGTATVALSLADLLLGTAERLGQHIRQGTLDTLLVRPVSPLVQLATEEFSPRRMGRLVPALVALAAGLSRLHVPAARLAVVPPMIAAGVWIFGALWVLAASWQFVLIDGEQATHSITYGGGFVTQYPLSVFGRDALRGLTYVLPLAFVNWEPALYVLHRPDPLGLPVVFRFASPLVALILSVLAALAWRTGLRHYRSTGS